MINGSYLINQPYNFKDICNIYSPTIKEVLSTPMYLNYYNILTNDQQELNDQFKEYEHIPTPFELVLNSFLIPQNIELLNNAFLFFIHEPVLPLQKQKAILIGDPKEAIKTGETRLLTEDNFFDFQNTIRIAMGGEPIENVEKYEDMDPRLRNMKLKRQEAKKIKNKQAIKNGDAATLEQNLVAIFLMGIGITPLNIGEITYAAIIAIIHGYQEKESYDVQTRIMTSGFASKNTKTPKYWMTQI